MMTTQIRTNQTKAGGGGGEGPFLPEDCLVPCLALAASMERRSRANCGDGEEREEEDEEDDGGGGFGYRAKA